jgi:hypothetical protein
MLAAEHSLYTYGALPKHKLLEIHSSKISLHHAKAGYSYPTIRLPHTFVSLVGLPTQIYQTVYDGMLAFLVVVSPKGTSRNASEQRKNDTAGAKTAALTRRYLHVRANRLRSNQYSQKLLERCHNSF